LLSDQTRIVLEQVLVEFGVLLHKHSHLVLQAVHDTLQLAVIVAHHLDPLLVLRALESVRLRTLCRLLLFDLSDALQQVQDLIVEGVREPAVLGMLLEPMHEITEIASDLR
jgi:hypothetical protein